MRTPSSRHLLLLPGLVLLVACGPQPDVAAEMQDAIRGAERALDASLLGAEPFWWAEAPPTISLRHGETCGCPCRERSGEGDGALLLLDYALDGCVPDSGLIPDELLGHVTLSPEADGLRAVPDGLTWEPAVPGRGSGREAVQTDAVGTWRDDTLAVRGGLRWGDRWTELDVTLRPGTDGIRLDGFVQTDAAWVDFDTVQLRWEDLRGRCPRASAGVIEVWAPGAPVRIDPAADRRVVATWSGESSLPTDPCDVL